MTGSGMSWNSVPVPCDLSDASWSEELTQSGFDCERRTFGSLLGISYYLGKAEFKELLLTIGKMVPEGPEICLDYPSEDESRESRVNRELASAAREEMKAQYSSREMEKLLEDCGFRITRLLDHEEMTGQYFDNYNIANPEHKMEAPAGVGYLLAVRTGSKEAEG